mgnify:CR=1 FL=1
MFAEGNSYCHTTGVLRGSGDTKYTARSALISIVFVRPSFSYLFVNILSFGIIGSWASMFIDQTLRMSLNNHRFVSLKWMHINV